MRLGPVGERCWLAGVFLGSDGETPLLACLLALLTKGVGLEAGVLATHSQELEGFEALARDHGHLLHFAEEADFIGREPGRKREGHARLDVCTMALLVLCSCCVIYVINYWMYRAVSESVGRACPR